MPDRHASLTYATDRIERLTVAAILERRERFALTDATHSRSTSKQKTRAQREAESARVGALCEALHLLTGEPTPLAVELRLTEEANRG